MTVPTASQSQLIEALLTLAAVLLQVTLLGIAIRTYRSQRTEPVRLLMLACICYVVPHVFEFLVYFVPGFLHADKIRLGYFRPIWWMQSLDQSSLILFLLFMIWALRAFTTKGNQQ